MGTVATKPPKPPVLSVLTDVNVKLKIHRTDLAKSELEISIANTTHFILNDPAQKLSDKTKQWVQKNIQDTAYTGKPPSCNPNVSCKNPPECKGIDVAYCWTCLCPSCGCGWEGVCEANKLLCQKEHATESAKQVLWSISDCGIAHAILQIPGLGDQIAEQILSQIQSAMVNDDVRKEALKALINDQEVKDFYNDENNFLRKQLMKC